MKHRILSVLCMVTILAMLIPAARAEESFVNIISYDTFDGSEVNIWDEKRMNEGEIENGVLVMRSESGAANPTKHGVLWSEVGGITWANHKYVIKARMTLNETGAENGYVGLDLATRDTGTCTMLVKLVRQDADSFNVMLNAPETDRKDGLAEPAYAALENVPAGEWVNMMLYISGNTVTYYVNGVNITSCTFTSNRPQVSGGVRFSAQYAGAEEPLEGFIDDAQMYAVATDYVPELELTDVRLDGGSIRMDFSEEIVFNEPQISIDGIDVTEDAVQTEDQRGIVIPCTACTEFEIYGLSGVFGSSEACGAYEFDSSTGTFNKRRPVVTKYEIMEYDDFTGGTTVNSWATAGGRYENDALVLTTTGDMIRQTSMYSDEVQGEWQDNVFVLKAKVTLTAVGTPSNGRFELGLCDSDGNTGVRLIQLAKSSDNSFNVSVNRDSDGTVFTGTRIISDAPLGTEVYTVTVISNNNVKYFINGSLAAQNTFTATPLSEASGVRFSVQFGASGAPLTAEIDNVEMYGLRGGTPALTVEAEESGVIGTEDSIEVAFSNEIDVDSLDGNVIINSATVPAERLRIGERQNLIIILPPEGGYLPQDTLEIVMRDGISDVFSEHLENEHTIQRTTGGWALSARNTAYSEGEDTAAVTFSVRNMTDTERNVVFVSGAYEGDASNPIVRNNANVEIRPIDAHSEKTEDITVSKTGTDTFIKVCAIEESGAPITVFNSVDAAQAIPEGDTSLVREDGYVQLIVAGETAQNEIVSLVLYVDDVIIYADSAEIGSDGEYRFALKLAPEMESGIYEYSVASKENALVAGAFAVNSENDLNGLLSAVQSAESAEDVQAGFEAYPYISELDVFTQIDKEALYSYLYAAKDQITTIEQLLEEIEKMTVTAALNQRLDAVMDEAETLVGNEDYTLYETLLSSNGISNVNNHMLGQDFETPSQAAERFRQLLYTNIITNGNTTGAGTATEIFEAHGEELGCDMSRYNNTSAKTAVIRHLVSSGAATPELLNEAYNNYFRGQTGTGGSVGGSTGSSSSHGSSASSPSYQSSILAEANLAEENEQEDVFLDMDGFEWAKPAVQALYGAQIISGISENEFAPSKQVTREEFVSMLIRVFNIQPQDTATPDFDDVRAGDWFYDAVYTARQIGIVDGYSENMFGAGSAITREEMATMAFRTLRYYSDNLSADNARNDFADGADISDFAASAIAVMSGYEIINGYDDGTFRPKETANRAEAAQIIYNIYEIKDRL